MTGEKLRRIPGIFVVMKFSNDMKKI